MGFANKFKGMVLATSNKSELAVGYSTIYGDMVGGFCVLKDVPKTIVYKLAKHINKKEMIIPNRIITREPWFSCDNTIRNNHLFLINMLC